MKLAVVVPVLGQHAMADVAFRLLRDNKTLETTSLFAFDNGRDYNAPPGVHLLRPKQNVGVYRVFKDVFDDPVLEQFDVIAFFHSDLMVPEKGYDMRVLAQFEVNNKLGMAGFVGSNEIDGSGGRGLGTCSNFQGRTYYGPLPHGGGSGGGAMGPTWTGSPAEVHGRRERLFSRAAVVDGCAMIIRRDAWNTIGFREDWPPHHFYDRLISTQMLEHGWEIQVIGVECDHISGQTVAKEERYGEGIAKDWCIANGIAKTHNWDDAIYREAERRWLYEYRHTKKLIPIRV